MREREREREGERERKDERKRELREIWQESVREKDQCVDWNQERILA